MSEKHAEVGGRKGKYNTGYGTRDTGYGTQDTARDMILRRIKIDKRDVIYSLEYGTGFRSGNGTGSNSGKRYEICIKQFCLE